MTEEHAIEAVGIEKSYGDVRVLDGVDLAVPEGSVFSLLGPNGAGKTTVVRILATLTPPDRGRVRVAGHEVVADRRWVRRHISLTGQHAALDEGQTGQENLRMMGRLCGLGRSEARAQAAVLLARFELGEAGTRTVDTYSGGMRRRLDLAASLVGRPRVLFLDEPTTGLDPRSRQAMWSVVDELVGDGVTVFLTTQYLEEADRLAHRVAVIDNGRVVAEGSPADLKRHVGGPVLELVLVDDEAYRDAVVLLGDQAIRCRPAQRTLSVPTGGGAAEVRAVLDAVDPARNAIESFGVHRATLDDVFMVLTGHAAGPIAPTDRREAIHV